MYDIYDVMLLIPLGLALLYWWRSSGQKSIATAAVRSYCTQRNLQFLDDTLLFRRWRFESDGGVRRLCRLYEFDYSANGEDRQSGELVLAGYRVLRVILHSDVLEITEYP